MEDKLKIYRNKRNFHKTTEPAGIANDEPAAIFVVQKHAATTLHYDFRLAIDGVLKSWAIPKEPLLHHGDKRLAIPTEDHPLEYQHFAGVIPEGEYGAGNVAIWDHGTYENLQPQISMQQAFKQGKILLQLHGKKLHGNYGLIMMRNAKTTSGKQKPWLFMLLTS